MRAYIIVCPLFPGSGCFVPFLSVSFISFSSDTPTSLGAVWYPKSQRITFIYRQIPIHAIYFILPLTEKEYLLENGDKTQGVKQWLSTGR